MKINPKIKWLCLLSAGLFVFVVIGLDAFFDTYDLTFQLPLRSPVKVSKRQYEIISPLVTPSPEPKPSPVALWNKSLASWYGNEEDGFCGLRTASGETYDCKGLTVAHKTLPFGTRVRFLYDPDGDGQGYVVDARVTDRGPFIPGREWDLSPAVFERLASLSAGVIPVKWRII